MGRFQKSGFWSFRYKWLHRDFQIQGDTWRKSQPPVESDKPSEQLLVYVLERMSVKETVPNAEGFLFQIEKKPFISQIEIKVRQPLTFALRVSDFPS